MIRSTFFGFGTALSGMRVSQKSLDVSGNNITNMNTEGYTRQRLDVYSVAASDGKNKFASQNNFQIGQGTGIIQVQQIRDPFLDVRYRRESSYIGESDARLAVMEEISAIFDETLDDKIQDALATFKSELQTFAEKPESAELEQVVKTSAEYLTKIINQTAKQLDTLREQEEYNLNADVDNINSILEKISVLNQNIKECEIFGAPALELRDERNYLIDELSQYMEIEVRYEEDLSTSPTTQNLKLLFKAEPNSVMSEEERVLVNNYDFKTIHIGKDREGQTQFYTIPGEMVEATDADGNPIYEMEDDGVTQKVDQDGNPIPVMDHKSLQFTQGGLKGAQQMLNDRGEFDDNPQAIRGIGYYEDMLDQFAKDFAAVYNEANSLKTGDKGFDDATAVDVDTNGDGNPDARVNERPLFESSDGGEITARTLQIADNWRTGQYTITTSKEPVPEGVADDGAGDNENVLHMITLLGTDMKFTTKGIGNTEDTAHDLMNGTFEEFLTSIGTTAATEAFEEATVLESHVNVLGDIADQRDSVSAVSLDEEGVDLLRYQKAYSAAARFATTLDQTLEKLINGMGVVGR